MTKEPQDNPPRSSDEITLDEYRDHRVEWLPTLSAILLGLTAGSLAIAAGIHHFAPAETGRLAAPLLLALISVLGLVAYQTGRITLGRSVLTYGLLAIVALSMTFSGGVRSAAMLAIAPIVITASVISPRTGRRMILMSGALLLAVGLAEYRQWLPAASPLPWGQHWLLNAIILLVAAGIGRYLNILLHARTNHERSIADQLKNEKAALRESEARLKEAQRIGHVGSWDMDIVGNRLLWSDEIYRIYEREPGSFGGTFEDLLEMVHPDDLATIRRAFRESAAAKGGYEIVHRIVTPGGKVKHLRVHWEVFFDADGKPVRALGTARDITEHEVARAEIRRLNDELEARVRARTTELQATNRELESFAYSISHDLRAPLRGIDGFGHLLLEEYGERLDEQGQDYLKRMRGAAQRMGTLIDDILELSRVTRKSMRHETIDLSQIAFDILENRTKSTPQRQVEVAIAPGCMATGDPQLLRVLMENLLENAWKYSRTTPQACIEFGREEADGEMVYFVRDNGVGFDMKYAGRLFGPFQRLHKPEEFEGTGIGLASAARVVHRHGGRIWAESASNQGATFRFTLKADGKPLPASAP